MPKTLNLRDERFRTLWTVIRWEGAVRNSQMQALFGCSAGQASRLIAEFRDAYPRKVEIDNKTKSWRPTDLNEAELQGGDVQEYLVIQQRMLGEAPEWYVDGRSDFLGPTERKFQLIRRACEEGLGLDLMYSSMRDPPAERRIYPHVMVQLSQRWHVRAWCSLRNEYRDFNFGRMRNLRPSSQPRPEMPGDQAWMTYVTLRVKPHRDLTPLQFEAVRNEFCDGALSRRIRLRGALVPYTLKEARIAASPLKECPPEYLLELMNRKDAKPYLFPSDEKDEGDTE